VKRQLLEKWRRGALVDPSGRPGIGPRPEGAASLSYAQERLWFLEQLQPGTAAYNMPAALRLRGPLDVGALGQSLGEIVRRHEALRTTFVAVEGRPFQVIAEPRAVGLPVIDLAGLPETEREAEAERLAGEEAQRPFDLARDLLLRARLLRLDEREHVLLLTLHHIACDAWSVGVLSREVAELYEAFSRGQPSCLPELPLQYADFAAWQRAWLQGETLATQLGYWKRRLAGVPPALELPTDRPRPAVPSSRGGRHPFTFPRELGESLQALGRREGGTLFMTLLGAFQVLLSRYTGSDDIVVGSPVAGRSERETERLIGLFVNTLVLRTDLSGDPTFRELLGRVREVCLDAHAHQDLPFEKLVEELQPERDPSRTPLFQVMFTLQNAPRAALSMAGLEVSGMAVDRATAKFDLSLSMGETERGLQGTLAYSAGLFDAATIARLARHYRTLLEGVVADPERRLSELPLLTEEERQQILVEWNATASDYPRERCVHELFEAQVERTPEAVAVACEGQHLTYRELNWRANQLAHHLRRLGVGPEVPVGICVERSLEMLVGLLGILKAGGAYVPLDPTCPLERLAFVLNDTRVPLLLTQERLVSRLPAHAVQVVRLDADWGAIGQAPATNRSSDLRPDNLAYVIYTSGSTGQPNGVAVEHRSLVNYLTWVQEHLFDPNMQSLPTATNLTFDASLKQVFGPLLSGGAVWVISDDLAADPAALLQAITMRAPAGLNCVPSVWQAILDTIRSGRSRGPSSLEHLFLGGEQLSRELVDRSLAELAQLRIWNLYGPTEATANATAGRIIPGEAVTIGRPIANTRIYILDQRLQPVPVGVPGELHIGGACLARGYLNCPKLTAERFIPDSFGGEPGGRLYRTGDLARYRPDGQIEFLGRLDDQVKVRGYRIELGEIEAALVGHPGVREAVVVAGEDEFGDNRLLAYIVSGESAPTASEARAFLREKLPEYMLPSAFVPLETLPRTPNGKPDRRALLTQDRARPGIEEAFVTPRTRVEELLASIWAEVLGVERVGIQEDFFDLGGHSLLAVRLFARIEQELGTSLPLSSLFQGPTIEHLARLIGQPAPAAPRSSLVPIQPNGSKLPFFWIHRQFGDVLCYADLARHLGPDQPCYGLEARGLDASEEPFNRVEDMAEHYIGQILAVQPEGPYALGGLCGGGTVAFEMARQLHARGQAVALVALLDSPAPRSRYREVRPSSTFVRDFLRDLPGWILEFLQLSHAERSQHIGVKGRRIRARLETAFRPGRSGPARTALTLIGEDGEPFVVPEQQSKVFLAASRAFRAYAPGIYPGRVTLFRPRMQPLLCSHAPDKGWGRLAAGGVDIRVVPGHLFSMLWEPHVRVLAEQLQACLDAARAAGPAAERTGPSA
jgi:amino acid adenylation domain-containing protein